MPQATPTGPQEIPTPGGARNGATQVVASTRPFNDEMARSRANGLSGTSSSMTCITERNSSSPVAYTAYQCLICRL